MSTPQPPPPLSPAHRDRPFACVENCDVLAHLQRGKRLERPVGCPPALYAIMSDCWLPDPATRPCFTTIGASLAAIRSHIPRQLLRHQQKTSLSSRISRVFSKLLRRSDKAPLDHSTRAALLAMVAKQRLGIEECQLILLDFQRGLLAGPPCPEGEVFALALMDRHRFLRRAVQGSARSECGDLVGQDVTEENIALHRSVQQTDC